MSTEAESQAERAYQRLRGEILHGALMPGERLQASKLQDQFSLGLTPIREALMRLSSEGLVATEGYRGSRVSETSRAELADLMATRRDIERLCLLKAMQHGDAAWEAEIISAMHLLSRTPLPDGPTDANGAALWEQRHRRFHHALVSACDSVWLMRFWSTLVDHSERYRKLRLLHRAEVSALVRDIDAEHRAIMDATVARNADRATALMDEHLRGTEQGVAPFLEFTAYRSENIR